jgi:translation initiation factor IF-3
VIGPEGNQLGIKSVPEALSMAKALDLDLVEVAPLANPPVCRIMDYGKYRYEESQRAKESRKKATHISIKEVKFRPKIGQGDFDTKVRHIKEFLTEGHKVKVTLQFRGREMAHPELGAKVLDGVAEQVGPLAKIEASPRLDGRNMTMVMAPDRKPPIAAPRKKGGDEGEVSADAGGSDAAESVATEPVSGSVATDGQA